MPKYAYAENQDLPCPYCGGSLRIASQLSTHHIKFWWGYCSSRSPGEAVYEVGDPIQWREGRDGIVHGWASFGGPSFNVGEPGVTDLTVTDIRGELSQLPWNCPTCDTVIGGAAIEIRAGLIDNIWVFSPGELESEAYYLTCSDGSRLRMQDWENKPNDYYES